MSFWMRHEMAGVSLQGGESETPAVVCSLTWPGNAIRRLSVRARWVPGRHWWGSVPTGETETRQDSIREEQNCQNTTARKRCGRLRGGDLEMPQESRQGAAMIRIKSFSLVRRGS